MAVRTEDLIRQTFDMLAKESTTPKALFVSRARLLALASRGVARSAQWVAFLALGSQGRLDLVRAQRPFKGVFRTADLRKICGFYSSSSGPLLAMSGPSTRL